MLYMMWQDNSPKPLPLTTVIQEALDWFREKHGTPGEVIICERCPIPEGFEIPIVHRGKNGGIVPDPSVVWVCLADVPQPVPISVPQIVHVVNTTPAQKKPRKTHVPDAPIAVLGKDLLEDDAI